MNHRHPWNILSSRTAMPLLAAALSITDIAHCVAAAAAAGLDLQVRPATVMEHDDGTFLWYHPRVAPVGTLVRTWTRDTAPGGVVRFVRVISASANRITVADNVTEIGVK